VLLEEEHVKQLDEHGRQISSVSSQYVRGHYYVHVPCA